MNKLDLDQITDQITFNKNGRAIINFEGKFGMVDTDGNIVIPFQYSHLCHCEEPNGHLILANLNNRYGFIDSKNNIAIPFDYSEATVFENDRSIVCKDDKHYVIDSKNKVIRKL